MSTVDCTGGAGRQQGATRPRTKREIEECPERPRTVPVRPKNIPASLRGEKRWVCWVWEWRRDKDGKGKWTKRPLNARTGRSASSTDPGSWSTFEKASAAYRDYKGEGRADGIGFVLGDGFVGVDLDDARDPATGDLHAWAKDDVALLGSYTEVSPSGTGVKVFLKGTVPPGGNRTGNYEIYGGGRYFAMTGRRLEGAPEDVLRRSKALAQLHARLFPTAVPTNGDGGPDGQARTDGEGGVNGVDAVDAGDSVSALPHRLTDDEVLEKARNARNRDKFLALWEGGKAGHKSASEADLALAGLLAFYCGPSGRDQVERLFSRSKRGDREKWKRPDYRKSTLDKAYRGRTEFYDPSKASRAGKTGGEKSQADLLVGLAEGLELFHTPGGYDADGYATVEVEGHKETWKLRSSGFKQWLARQFYLKYGKALGGQALTDALNVICGKAACDGEEHEVYVRVAPYKGRVYLDRGDDQWQAVRVDKSGWEVVPRPRVKFRRSKGTLPLPEPVEGGSVGELRRFVNVTDRDWPLLLGWLVSALHPKGPFAVLCLYGEQGAAKTTTACVLRRLVGPNVAPTRASPKEPRDLAIAANNGWVISLNNLSWLPDWLSDTLCRLNAGEGFSTRTLYTDEDETIFRAARPIILNGIEEVATRGDLLDRALVLNLPALPDERRKTEAEFYAAFEEAAPRILGALLGAVSAGLRNLPEVKMPRLPRMADFAKWVVACESALGLEPGEFLRAYAKNRKVANETVLETSVVAAPLRSFLEGRNGRWKGTASSKGQECRLHSSCQMRT